MKTLAIISAILCGCGGENVDSGIVTDTYMDQEFCENPEYGGTVSGTPNCNDGICEIPAGSFWMGSTTGRDDECPPRIVELSSFKIDQLEVSRGEYDLCVEDGGCEARPLECGVPSDEWDSSMLPATCVDHAQASTYCEWAGGRLPTEAEWERAGGGDDGVKWAWGNRSPTCDDANFRFVSWYCHTSVIEVGHYPNSISPWGLLDTAGNAWEWTSDYYDSDYYTYADNIDPLGPELCSLSKNQERGECHHRVIRGGAFNTTEDTTTSSERSFAHEDAADDNIGFRCAHL